MYRKIYKEIEENLILNNFTGEQAKKITAHVREILDAKIMQHTVSHIFSKNQLLQANSQEQLITMQAEQHKKDIAKSIIPFIKEIREPRHTYDIYEGYLLEHSIFTLNL